MKTSLLVVIVSLALALADVEGANLRQLADKHASPPMMGRMEAHKTTAAKMEAHKTTQTKMEAHKVIQTKMESHKTTQTKLESHKTTQTKMESQFKLPVNIDWGKIFSKHTQTPETTAPPKAVATTAPPAPPQAASLTVPPVSAPPIETNAPASEPTDDPETEESVAWIDSPPVERTMEPPGSFPRPNNYNGGGNDYR